MHRRPGPSRLPPAPFGGRVAARAARAARAVRAVRVVGRTAHTRPPYRVEYALTGLGRSLHTALLGLGAWADEHRGQLARQEDPLAPRRPASADGAGGADTA
ncbi:winged helix-turn-helix transcriptional regulator [Streptomyces sp. CB01881]|uniref:winged helix-turn-helix transcriptional regulator n=1 Tax=Streptomyces sp. CB01881 TaxID=2078691 RepID=UPI000CDC89A9|nr:winged helix-turn-helix transcriptional regulator [Streptomyces sp. CB01881]AUY48843.1 hypothetical protein C2142_07660 [Streptomyces sp. CB01881]TYC77332.1 hypothetical protein EH183_07665 [Streptomyces sp. CB01881]